MHEYFTQLLETAENINKIVSELEHHIATANRQKQECLADGRYQQHGFLSGEIFGLETALRLLKNSKENHDGD